MRKLFFIMTFVMMFFAVEGYAQRQSGSRGSSTYRSSSPSHHVAPTRPQSSSHHVAPSRSQSSRHHVTQTRPQSSNYRAAPGRSPSLSHQSGSLGQRPYFQQGNPRKVVENRGNGNPNVNANVNARGRGDNRGGHHNTVERPHHSAPHHSAPHHGNHHHSAPHHGNHHHSHFTHGPRHYKYSCPFNVWRWVSYLDYHRRFICHGHYADNYYDTMLGYYVYGSLQTPSRIVIGRLELRRSHNHLSTCNAGYCKSYYVYEPAHLVYYVGYKTVDVTVGDGLIVVKIFDEWGNSAMYYL